ncbi:receptor-type tyrosine-protein phosphatase kappa-like isoform X1 [Elysia marginata]|uniref:Receptor-type tyrosine-protein phosphatase kappa-like isoform X1 n=1 Tax=Elysia marginata TaxID=1093978 RepID=A0AAV4JNY5_9GAST|nr:receptor-type tyrosine-protein phosphatase kappa-like isoform X1 [Elysia marginata]
MMMLQVRQREAGRYAFRCTAKIKGAKDSVSSYLWLNFGNVTSNDNPNVTERCTLPGWFGNKCKYLCHCADDEDCDKTTGHCSSGCAIGWLGHACQYGET